MRAKAPESLCAGGLSKSKEKMLYTGMTRFRDACRRGGRRERLLQLHGGNIDCIARTRKSVCEGRCKANGKIAEQEGKTYHSGSAGALRQGGGGEKKQSEKPAETFCFSGFQTVEKVNGNIADFR